jgi:hypothetical protein
VRLGGGCVGHESLPVACGLKTDGTPTSAQRQGWTDRDGGLDQDGDGKPDGDGVEPRTRLLTLPRLAGDAATDAAEEGNRLKAGPAIRAHGCAWLVTVVLVLAVFR